MDDMPVAAAERPQFVDAARRIKVEVLDYPVTYAGKTYDRIEIRRLTAAEVAATVEEIRKQAEEDPNGNLHFPMYFDVDGQPVPQALLDGLDDDDASRIQATVNDFLPRRFRGSGEE
ncbi:MAG TPA: phage tail assembly protein [Xanthobacteraceae bacterium]|nr:phage tail assembly protein [Xanthobacteraceae bacterium]